MENQNKRKESFLVILSYVLVAALASSITFFAFVEKPQTGKLAELEKVIAEYFIGEVNSVEIQDAAASAMVEVLPDRWSYYIPASQYAAYMEQANNAYVGIGVTISAEVGEQGIQILSVEETGGAKEAGILPGDILTTVNGESILENGVDKSRELIKGEEGTTVEIGVLREGQPMTFQVQRKTIQVVVAQGQMLPNNIGLVKIANFDSRCAEETIGVIQQLLEQGAKSLIFDVRNNPGGFKTELTEVLDYLLPKGEIFRSLDYAGREQVTQSDEDCLEIPMAVLINENSFSAAEFFAAALNEYDWAVIVGEKTVGKGYFQQTYQLSDGSAIGLSVGKYFTPKGVSLAEAGGLTPEIPVSVEAEIAAKIYAETLAPEEDPQIQAAVEALLS